MLCQACQGIFDKSEWAGYGSTIVYPHSTYTKDIRDGQQNGCQICNMLCLHFEAVNEPAEKLDLTYIAIDSSRMWKSLDFFYTNVDGDRDETPRGDKHFVVLTEKGIYACPLTKSPTYPGDQAVTIPYNIYLL